MLVLDNYGDDDGSDPDPLKMHHTCGGASWGRVCKRCDAERQQRSDDVKALLVIASHAVDRAYVDAATRFLKKQLGYGR